MASDTAVGRLDTPAAREHRAAGTAWSPERLIGLAGLTSFVVIIVGAFVSPPLWEAPGTMAPANEVVAYSRDNADRIIAGLLIYSVGMGLFLCFAGGLWSWLREREAAPKALSAIFGLGAVAMAVLIFAAFVPGYLLSYRTQPASVAGPLADLTFGLLALSGIPTAVCLGAYAALVMKLRCLPRWTAWLAIDAAVLHVLIAASFVSHGDFLSLEGSVIVWIPAFLFAWILAASVVMLRRRPGAR